MRVISLKKLRVYWEEAAPDAESPLRTWYQTVKAAGWTCFADVRRTYAAADLVGNKVVFNIGGNKYRLIAVIDYEGHKVFVCHVLDHKAYDKENWKKDTFGEDWTPRHQDTGTAEPKKSKGQSASEPKQRRRRKR
jgi:mRNA interferase HigB